MVDLKRYLKLRDKGLTDVVMKDNIPYLQFKRFSVEDGQPIEPEEQMISIDEISKRKDEINKELKGADLLLQELQNKI